MPEGVVGALNTIHAALRPAGLLLDIHPEPEHARVEVRLCDRTAYAGRLDNSSRIATVLTARAGLARVTEAGTFLLDRAVRFPFLYTYDSVDAWLEQMRTGWTSTVVPPKVIARVRALLPGGEGEVRVRRRIRAARLRRSSPCTSSSSSTSSTAARRT